MRLKAAVASSVASHVVTIASGLISVPLFLRAFGRDPFGFWAALLGITAYLSLLNLGVAQAVSSGVSRTVENKEIEIPRLVQKGVRFYARMCAIAIPVVGGAALLSPWATWFSLGEAFNWSSRLAAFAVFVTFLLELPFSVFRAALYGSGQVAQERWIGILQVLLRLGLAYVFSLTNPPLWLAVVALSLVNLGCYASSALRLRRAFPKLLSFPSKVAEPTNKSAADNLFGNASRDFFLVQIAGAILWSTDPLIAGFVLGPGAAAQVSAAWRVFTMILALGGIIAPALAPTLTQLWASGEKAKSNQLAMDAAQVVFAMVSAATLGAAFAGQAIFSLWLGQDMFIGRWAWAAYCVLLILQAVTVIPDAFVMQAAEHKRYARSGMVEATVKVLLGIVLMRYLGLAGLPFATLIARAATTGWLLPLIFVRATEQKLLGWLWSVVRPSLVPAAVFAGTFLAGMSGLAIASPLGTFVVGFVAGVGFVVVFLVWGLPSSLRALLRRRASS